MESEQKAPPGFDFARLWTESITRLMQNAFTAAPNVTPDALRQARSALFQSQASAWDEYLRSPAFLEWMRQFSSNTVTWRRMTNDWLARVRTELQAPSREDIEMVLLSLQHLEKRLLDRMNELSPEGRRENGAGRATQPKSTNRKRSRRRRTTATRKP